MSSMKKVKRLWKQVYPNGGVPLKIWAKRSGTAEANAWCKNKRLRSISRGYLPGTHG